MASTPVSFDEVKILWDEHYKNRLRAFNDCIMFGKGYFVVENGTMTFEDVAKIEALRRQIEKLQVMLTSQASMEFGVFDKQSHVWRAVGKDLDPVLRETLCKHTVVQITKLLDDAARLGVDVSISKEVLLKVLEEIKPKQEEDHDMG